jgi:GNAT superfamily N-acetyltransferase
VGKKMKPNQIKSIDPYEWTDILRESKSEGHNMVNRLVTEFKSGTNRFDATGEVLFAHLSGNAVVAVAGMNREKDSTFGQAGRVRRLYVVPRARGKGLARRLVEEIASSAVDHFDVLTVNVGKLDARGFYEHLGFHPVENKGITHVKKLKNKASNAKAPTTPRNERQRR